MKSITSNKTYPEPNLQNTNEQDFGKNKPKPNKHRSGKLFSSQDFGSIDETDPEVNENKSEVEKTENLSNVNIVQNIDHDKNSFRNEIESMAKHYMETFSILPAPTNKCNLVCHISQEEFLCAKNDMQRLARKDEVSGFDRRNEYFLHEVDHILKLMKTNAITTVNNETKSPSIEIMLCQAFNSLMRLRLESPTESIEMFLLKVNEMFPNGLFHSETDIVLTGLYSSVGIKKRLRRGNFQYDSRTNSTQGLLLYFPLLSKVFTHIYGSIMTLKKTKTFELPFY